MPRIKQSVHQIGVKLTQSDLDALDTTLEHHRGHPLDGVPDVQTRSDVTRIALRTLAFLTEPFDDAEVLALQELSTRFGTTPIVILSALLNDANARAVVKRNLAELAGRRDGL